MIVSNSSSPGNAIQASTKRCTAKSSLPPRNPDVPPIRVATTTFSVVAARPTTSEIRAPNSRRLNRSRPNWSVPSRWRADGPAACLTIVYFIIKDRVTYDDLGEDYYDRRRQEQLKRHHIKRLQRLGYSVEVTEVQPAA